MANWNKNFYLKEKKSLVYDIDDDFPINKLYDVIVTGVSHHSENYLIGFGMCTLNDIKFKSTLKRSEVLKVVSIISNLNIDILHQLGDMQILTGRDDLVSDNIQMALLEAFPNFRIWAISRLHILDMYLNFEDTVKEIFKVVHLEHDERFIVNVINYRVELKPKLGYFSKEDIYNIEDKKIV